MNKPRPFVPRCIMSGWVVLCAFLTAGFAPFLSAAPGPTANAAVDLAGYRTVLHVDRERGDDIKGNGSTQKPLASLVRALELAGRPGAANRVAVLVTRGR